MLSRLSWNLSSLFTWIRLFEGLDFAQSYCVRLVVQKAHPPLRANSIPWTCLVWVCGGNPHLNLRAEVLWRAVDFSLLLLLHRFPLYLPILCLGMLSLNRVVLSGSRLLIIGLCYIASRLVFKLFINLLNHHVVSVLACFLNRRALLFFHRKIFNLEGKQEFTATAQFWLDRHFSFEKRADALANVETKPDSLLVLLLRTL